MTATSPKWLEGWLEDYGFVNADASSWWRACADEAICVLARRGSPFTFEDALELGVPIPSSRAAWAHVLSAASKRGWIQRVGYVESRQGPARPVVVYEAGQKLPDEAAAVEFASAGALPSMADAVAAVVAAVALVEVLAAQLIEKDSEREFAVALSEWDGVL